MLEVARAYAALPVRPHRSILFLFVTAEERGLLGSDYFARHPTVPGDGIVADFTLDMPFLYHPLLDIVPYGAQHSTLLAPVTRAAQHLGIAIATDPIPEQVLFIDVADAFHLLLQQREDLAALEATRNVLMDASEKHAGYTHISLAVRDVRAVKALLEKDGVEITEGPITFDDGATAIFVRDPDRNVIEFNQAAD